MNFRAKHPILGGIVDVETTGLSPAQDEIIELCIVLFSFDHANGQSVRIEEEYVGMRQPGCGIQLAAARVNGISAADVYGRDLDYERVSAMIERADFLIAHNASFDRNFMMRLFPEVQDKDWYCSMAGINWKGKGYPNRRLQDLLYHHHIVPKRTHRASDDVYATMELLSHRQDCGTTYLYDLLFGIR